MICWTIFVKSPLQLQFMCKITEIKCLKCSSTRITTIQYPTENRIDHYCRTCQDTLSLDNITVSIAKPQSTRQKAKLQNRTVQIQQQKLPERTLRGINSQKLIDRKRFSDLSAKAMNPNVATSFLQPQLNGDDIKLVGAWCEPQQNNLDRTSIIKAQGKEKWEFGRLLSARAAEKVAMDFYRHYGKKVKDISITQIDENDTSDYWNYDLDVDGVPIDVKNSRRAQNSPDRYTEHYIQKGFKHSRDNQEVIISGGFSPYLWPHALLEPTEYHGDTTIQFLGETTHEKQQALKSEFRTCFKKKKAIQKLMFMLNH